MLSFHIGKPSKLRQAFPTLNTQMNPSNAVSQMKSILCVGNLSVDLITECSSTINQLDESLTSLSQLEWHRGGHASNVSYVLSMLGAPVEFFGVLSRSCLLREILEQMKRRNIDFSHCPKTNSTPAFTYINRIQKVDMRSSILHCTREFPFVTMDDFRKLDIEGCGWAHFENSRSKEDTLAMMRAILDYNNNLETPIRISLKVESFFEECVDLFRICDYVIFSKQLALELGWNTPKETCLQLNKILSQPLYICIRRPCFICSWGDLGAGCLDIDGEYTELPVEKLIKKPVDSYRVGDCFTSAVIYALYVRRMSLKAAVAFGNRVAAHKLTKIGYEHIANLNTYPVTLTGIPDPPVVSSEEDEVVNNDYRRLWNREIQYSDGRLATELLQMFPTKDFPIEVQMQVKQQEQIV